MQITNVSSLEFRGWDAERDRDVVIPASGAVDVSRSAAAQMVRDHPAWFTVGAGVAMLAETDLNHAGSASSDPVSGLEFDKLDVELGVTYPKDATGNTTITCQKSEDGSTWSDIPFVNLANGTTVTSIVVTKTGTTRLQIPFPYPRVRVAVACDVGDGVTVTGITGYTD